MGFLIGITVLLVCQLVGEVLVLSLALPIPGPVVGMLLLLLALTLRGKKPVHPLPETANALLSHLSLLFVPAGVGVIVHAHRLEDEWLPITAALLLGTLITLAVTALVMQVLMRIAGNPAGDDGRD